MRSYGCFHHGISVSIRRDIRHKESHLRTQQEGSCLQARERALTRTQPWQHPVLRHLASKRMRNILLLIKPHSLWYFVMGAQGDNTQYQWSCSIPPPKQNMIKHHWQQRLKFLWTDKTQEQACFIPLSLIPLETHLQNLPGTPVLGVGVCVLQNCSQSSWGAQMQTDGFSKCNDRDTSQTAPRTWKWRLMLQLTERGEKSSAPSYHWRLCPS